MLRLSATRWITERHGRALHIKRREQEIMFDKLRRIACAVSECAEDVFRQARGVAVWEYGGIDPSATVHGVRG